MAIHTIDHQPTPAPPTEDLLFRVTEAFDEMPTLRLTLGQAMRLFGLDRAACLNVLGILVDAGLVERDAQGRYCRAHRR